VAQISTPHGIDLAVQNPECYWVRDNRLLGVSPNKCVIDNQNLAHNFVNVLQHIDSPHYSFFSEGIRKVGDNPATVVDVNANGAVTRWWIGEDGRLLQELYFSNETIGLGTLIYRYTEWKEVDQLNYPVTYESRDEIREGAPIVSRISKVELNPTVDPTLFIKPDSKRN